MNWLLFAADYVVCSLETKVYSTYTDDDLHDLVPEQGREGEDDEDGDGEEPGPGLSRLEPSCKRADPTFKV